MYLLNGAFGGALNLHQTARAGQDKVSVRLGGAIFAVIKSAAPHP